MSTLHNGVLSPAPLKPGDTIGLVAPASPVADPMRIRAARAYFEQHGYRVRIGDHAECTNGFLAGTDEERVADLHAMAEDDDVRAIVCLRGGYGTMRILPLIDFDLFRRHPKILIGFSDITALQLALWHRCRLVTFHGPMAAVDFSGMIDPTTEQSFWSVLGGSCTSIALTDGGTEHVLQGGQCEGTILGGNLSLVAALCGSLYLPDFHGAILLLEEVGEEPYRLDRLLLQLRLSGLTEGLRGLILGGFNDCEPRQAGPSCSSKDVLAAFAEGLRVPCLAGCRFGHIAMKMTIPIGIHALLDTRTGMLEFRQNAVA